MKNHTEGIKNFLLLLFLIVAADWRDRRDGGTQYNAAVL